MTATAVNANTAPEVALFLKALFAGKPDDLRVLLWTLPEKRSNWFQNVESAIQFAESMRQRDLLCGRRTVRPRLRGVPPLPFE